MTQLRFDDFMLSIEIGSDEEIKSRMTAELIKMRDRNGVTPLHRAVKERRTSLISEFVKIGADIDAQTKYKNTPLHWAAFWGYVDVIEILVSHGALLDIIGEDGWTAQQKAKKYRRTTAAEFLENAEIEEKLFQSAIQDDLDQFQQLFTKKYNLFTVDCKTHLTLHDTLISNKSNTIINFIRSKEITQDEMSHFCKLYNESDAGFMKALEKNPLAKFFITGKLLDFEENNRVEYANKYTALNFKYPPELAESYGSLLVLANIQKYLNNEEDEETKEKIPEQESAASVDYARNIGKSISSPQLLDDIQNDIQVCGDILNTLLMEIIELAATMKGNITSQLIEVIKRLVPTRNDVHLDAEFRDDKTILQKALEAENEELILALTKSKPKVEKFTEDDFLFCIEMKFYEFIEEHISRLPKLTVENAITKDVFISVLDDASYQCIKLLYRYSCDNNKDLLIENMLYVIYSRNVDIDYAKHIIRKSINSPQLLANGETLLTFMIGKNDIQVCDDILNEMTHCDKLVNMKNTAGDLPIHLAVKNKQFEFVSSLLPLMKDLNEDDTNGETILHFLIRKLDESDEEDDKKSIFKIIKLVLSNGGNIYLRSQILGRSPIEECKHLEWKSKIEEMSHKIRPPQEAGASLEQINQCTTCYAHEIDCILSCGHKCCLDCGFKENRCPICRIGPAYPTRLTYD